MKLDTIAFSFTFENPSDMLGEDADDEFYNRPFSEPRTPFGCFSHSALLLMHKFLFLIQLSQSVLVAFAEFDARCIR